MFALRDIDMKKNFISPKSIYIDLIFLKKIIAIGYRLVLSQTAKKFQKIYKLTILSLLSRVTIL